MRTAFGERVKDALQRGAGADAVDQIIAEFAELVENNVVERRHRVLAKARGIRKFSRLDHFLQHRLDLFRLALLQPFQHAKQIDVARRVRGEREPRHAADCQLFDAVAFLRPWQKRDNLRDRTFSPVAK